MIELPLVFLGGLLGSAHCIGMCGGFAVSIGLGSSGLAANVRRQLVYTSGRIFTYSFFGIAAGYAGYWMAGRARIWINAQAVLSLIAGIVLLAQGSLPWESCRGASGRSRRWRPPLPCRNLRRAVPRLVAVVRRFAGGRVHRVSAVWPGLRLPGAGEQLGEHR